MEWGDDECGVRLAHYVRACSRDSFFGSSSRGRRRVRFCVEEAEQIVYPSHCIEEYFCDAAQLRFCSSKERKTFFGLFLKRSASYLNELTDHFFAQETYEPRDAVIWSKVADSWGEKQASYTANELFDAFNIPLRSNEGGTTRLLTSLGVKILAAAKHEAPIPHFWAPDATPSRCSDCFKDQFVWCQTCEACRGCWEAHPTACKIRAAAPSQSDIDGAWTSRCF